MQILKASSTARSSRWLALVIAIAASATMPRVHATDAGSAPDGAGIGLTVSMSVDPLDPPTGYDNCGAATNLVAYTGENVRWCYQITNLSDASLTRHTLQSSQFGTVLSDFTYTLSPGASAFITQMAPVTASLTETATWRAYTPATPFDFTDSASATLTVRPGVELTITASIDPVTLPPGYDACGTQSTVPAIPGRTVRWCYTIRNASSIARTRHTLISTQNGSVLNDFPYTLTPGASAFITATQVMGATAIDEAATWTAFRPGPVHLSTSTATARVLSVADVILITGFDPGT